MDSVEYRGECCFEGDFGRCRSRLLSDDSHPQASLGILYLRYYAEQDLTPPLDESALALAISHVLDRAQVSADDRFCQDHAPAVETRLRYELAQEVDVPEMGQWLHSDQADSLAHDKPRLPDLDLVHEMDIPDLDVAELGHDGLAA